MSTDVAQSQVQAPATTTTQAPATAPASAANSNAAAQAAAGLTGEATPTTVEGGLLGALSAVGSCAGVVLDVLPINEAFSLAVQALSLESVRDWVYEQPLANLYLCKSDVVQAILNQVVPAGSFLEMGSDVAASMGFGPNASMGVAPGVRFERGESSASFTAQGCIDASVGAAVPAVSAIEANGERVGAWAEMGIGPGAQVKARWDVDFADIDTVLGAATGTSIGQAGELDSLEGPIAAAAGMYASGVPAAVECTGSMGAGADAGAVGLTGDSDPNPFGTSVTEGVGQWLPELADLLGAQFQLAGAAAASVTVGYDGPDVFLRFQLECTTVAVAQLGSSGDKGTTQHALAEVRLAMPAAGSPTANAAELLHAGVQIALEMGEDNGEGEGSRERLEFSSMAQAQAALRSGGGDAATLTVGDLVYGRQHVLVNPEAAEGLMGMELEAWGWNAAGGGAEQKVSADVEIVVHEEVLSLNLLPYDPTDVESAREVERVICLDILGETNRIDAARIPDLPVDIRRTEITVETVAYAGGGVDVATTGGEARSTTRMGQTHDVADEMTLDSVNRLLSA